MNVCGLLERASVKYDLRLNVAIKYGARAEIVRAAQELAASGGEISERTFAQHLYTRGCSDPDLIVRTGGEMRLSNFLLYQAAYSELYFTDVLWPDMQPSDVDEARSRVLQAQPKIWVVSRLKTAHSVITLLYILKQKIKTGKRNVKKNADVSCAYNTINTGSFIQRHAAFSGGARLSICICGF